MNDDSPRDPRDEAAEAAYRALSVARAENDRDGFRAAVRKLAEGAGNDEWAKAQAALKPLNRLPEDAPGATIRETMAAIMRDADRPTRRAIIDGAAEAPAQRLPADTWEAAEPPVREWLFRGLMPKGRLCSLYGDGGAGKSRLALQIAASVMHGGAAIPVAAGTPNADGLENDNALCRNEGAKGKVLWLTWEDETDEFRRRWRMAHGAAAVREAFPDPKLLTLVDMRKLGWALWGPREGLHVSTAAGWTDTGRRFLATLPGHVLAIIDPLAAAYASSEIDRALVRAFTSSLDAAAEAAGCAILIIGHPPKGEATYSGSTDWQASVRSMLSLDLADTGTGKERAQAKGYRLMHSKSSYSATAPTLWLARHWNGGDAPELAWKATNAETAASRHRTGGSGRKFDINSLPDEAFD